MSQRPSPGNESPVTPESEQQRTAGLLALEIMHEVRNPVEAISNLVYLAMAEADNADRVRLYLEQTGEQIASLIRITNQTLAFARGSQLATSISMRELAESALRIHHRAIAARKIHLVTSFPESFRVDARGGQLLQVVSNLLSNSLDALPDGGTLSIRLRRRGRRVILLVADNGHGIRQRDIARIFEPFFTAKTETGTGLGLSLSKKIVEEHGGNLRVRSTVRPDRIGTVFRIALPA
jgi:signal transduction histidine kinase